MREDVGVHARPPVPGPALGLAEADDSHQHEVVVKTLSGEAAARVSTAGVRKSLRPCRCDTSLGADLVTNQLPGRRATLLVCDGHTGLVDDLSVDPLSVGDLPHAKPGGAELHILGDERRVGRGGQTDRPHPGPEGDGL